MQSMEPISHPLLPFMVSWKFYDRKLPLTLVPTIVLLFPAELFNIRLELMFNGIQ